MRIQSKSKAYSLLSVAVLVSLALLIGVLSLANLNEKATALSAAADFKAGNIIDDAVFYDKNSMDVNQIQSFLNQQIPNCDVWGVQKSGYGNLTRAQYAVQIMGWHGAPYPCMTTYHENPNTGETSFEKGGGSFAGGISAAQIIYNAAQKYGISPKVLLVMLKKESAGPLTHDSWPLKSQYKFAMGYACPDSGPGNSANCNSERAGFYKQMTLAAWQFKYYKDHPNDYRYKIGWNKIQYSPNVNCGTKDVYIENVATLSLYIYTPYTPNQGALSNYPGEANCGAYGNRNFFMFFKEWFGSTRGSRWTNLIDQRVMRTNKVTYKIDPDSGANVQNLTTGMEIKFSTKTTLDDNRGCLRTQFDTINGVKACVVMNDLGEINPIKISLSGSDKIQKQSTQWTCKVNYRTLEATEQCFDASTVINFASRTSVAGVDYLITKVDSSQNNSLAFRADRFEDTDFLSIQDRTQASIRWTCKIDLITGKVMDNLCFEKGTNIDFVKTTSINGTEYLTTKHDFDNSNEFAFLAERFTKAK